jgi:hypothetical protein
MRTQHLDQINIGGVQVPGILGRAGGFDYAAYIERAETPSHNVQPINYVATEVLQGQQVERIGVASQIFPFVRVGNLKFEYWTWSDDHVQQQETLRGESQPYLHSDFRLSATQAKLERRSWASMADELELQNADSRIQLDVLKALNSRRIVEMSEEFLVSELLQTSGTYAVNHTLAIDAGEEWDHATAAHMLEDIDTGTTAISDATGLQPRDLHMFLPLPSYRAAIHNPAFADRRAHVLGATEPSLAELANYFGLGRVWTANLIGRATGAASVAPLYDDVAVIYAPGRTGDYDRSFGDTQFAARFGMNDGVIRERFWKPEITSWVFPYDRLSKYSVLNSGAAFLITNTSSVFTA